jgi:hypothetical protein
MALTWATEEFDNPINVGPALNGDLFRQFSDFLD